jgi:hypothetical protein
VPALRLQEPLLRLSDTPTDHVAAVAGLSAPDQWEGQRVDDQGTAVVEARLAPLEVELIAAAGGSLCAISRSVGSVPAAKYLEGRLAALMALRRAMRGGESSQAALAALLGDWRRGLEDVTARDAGPDWRAYRAGGVDELEELEARLAEPRC